MSKSLPIFTIFIFSIEVYAQEPVTVEDYQRAESFLSANTRSLMLNGNVTPNWFEDSRMWYRNTVKNGAEFIIVDADKKTRKVAFDHQRIADAISNKDTTYDALGLPFRSFKYIKNGTWGDMYG